MSGAEFQILSCRPKIPEKPALIKTQVETAATSRMFKPLRQYGRTICFADGWFGSEREGRKNSPISFIEKTGNPFLWRRSAAYRSSSGIKPRNFDSDRAAYQELVNIHDHRPLVLVPESAREWMRQDIGGKEATEIAADGSVLADHFT